MAAEASVARRAPVCVLIAGSNGQQPRDRLTHADYAFMLADAQRALLRDWQLEARDVVLLAGGGAWAEHVAVDMFLLAYKMGRPFAGLRVRLPCHFAWAERRALARAGHTRSPRFSAGGVLNAAHAAFSTHLQRTSWDDLVAAQRLGATIEECDDGMHARNRRLAHEAQRLLAFTRDGVAPVNGSVRQVWDLCTCPRVHVKLPGDAAADSQASRARRSGACTARPAAAAARHAPTVPVAARATGKRGTDTRDTSASEAGVEKRACL